MNSIGAFQMAARGHLIQQAFRGFLAGGLRRDTAAERSLDQETAGRPFWDSCRARLGHEEAVQRTYGPSFPPRFRGRSSGPVRRTGLRLGEITIAYPRKSRQGSAG